MIIERCEDDNRHETKEHLCVMHRKSTGIMKEGTDEASSSSSVWGQFSDNNLFAHFLFFLLSAHFTTILIMTSHLKESERIC